MQKVKRIALLFSIFLILLISIAAVSAVKADDTLSSGVNEEIVETGIGLDECSLNVPADGSVEDNGDIVLCSDSSSDGADSKSSLKGNGKSSLKDSLDSVYYVDSDNLDSFFADGFLKDDYADSILVFNGEFNDKGILDIKSSNVTIIGNNSLLKDTVFCLESNNIMLAGLNFVWNREFSDNDNAGILVLGDNCTIYNCTIDYSVPETTTGFCVYAEGSDGDKIENFTLANSTINFVGNNLRGGWDYCIFVDQVENAMVYGNDINSSLPLRAVNYAFDIFGGVSMEAVGVFVAQSCPNLTFSSNKVFSSVNGGGNSYPTLDTLVIYGCNDAKIENNDIHVEDFNSKDGKDNYLQGIDLYFSNNVTIVHNKIDIKTTGGRAGMGTAYPIQVNGPSKGVMIAYNNLTTFNFGPNCGIYSMNYYGQTQNYMISNFINVTGVASTHYYALVAGIEVQDSDDLIWNNTIIVNNIGEYSDSNNIYGISYSQSTDGNHKYNIQYNNVTTNGRYAVSGQERYDYTLISEDEMINQRFWCPDALHAEDNAYLYKVEYTNDKEKLYPTLFREGDKGKYIKMNLLGKYKSKYWSFQNEWRYLLQCYPDHFTLNEELQARFVEIATNLIKNGDFKPIFSHIDLKVSQESFEDMEITLAPCVTEGQRAIVEALKASYNPNLVIRDSALSGLIR